MQIGFGDLVSGGERKALAQALCRADIDIAGAVVTIFLEEGCTLGLEQIDVGIVRHLSSGAVFGGGPRRHCDDVRVSGQLIEQAAQNHWRGIPKCVVDLLVACRKELSVFSHGGTPFQCPNIA